MGYKLPLNQSFWIRDQQGLFYLVEISIVQTDDVEKYAPDGVKGVFKIFRESGDSINAFELILLIDNHKPLGFHIHNELPQNHESRKKLYVENWQDTWLIFSQKIKEIVDET